MNEKSLKNLKLNSKQTPIERKELAKKVGIKSGIVKKEKAKQALELILSSKPTKPIQDVLIQSGITMPENTDILEALIYLATIKARVEKAT